MSWKTIVANTINATLRPYDIRVVRGVDLWHPATQLGKQPPPQARDPGQGSSGPFFKTYLGESVGPLQTPFDFTVVMPSILRPTIGDAIASVFAQDFPGRVQLLIGVDAPMSDLVVVDNACRDIPPYHVVQVLYPGYSTSRRHGGVHPEWVGGALRTIITYLANSRYVAYLDDDNWYATNHLSSLHEALQGHDWAYSLRWFVHPATRRPICEDRWESIGPVPTTMDPEGWVDPNSIAIDKLACEAVLRWWCIPQRNSPGAMDADRNVFRILSSEFRGRGTNDASVYYTITESDRFRHPFRVEMMGAARYAAAGVVEDASSVPASHHEKQKS
jgi:hypothetical protein